MIEKDYRNLFEIEYNKIKLHTIQLFTNNSQINALGSGVFVRIHEQYFILSASHVLKGIDDDNLVYIKSNSQEIFSLQGELTYNLNETSEGLDLGIFKLTNQSAKHVLRYYEAISSNQILTNYFPKKNEIMTISGFPEKSTSVTESSIESKGIIMDLDHAKDAAYRHHRISKERCILLNYRYRDHINGKFAKLEDPHGYSGGGLWTIKRYQEKNEVVPKLFLLGILYKFSKSRYYVFFVERMEYVVEEIERKYQLGIIVHKMNLKN